MFHDLYTQVPFCTFFPVCFILHLIADFNLQGMLGNLKMKEWWQKNYPAKMYEYDYLTAGWLHAFFWSCFTFLPFAFTDFYKWAILCNFPIHFLIDYLKANKRCISLTSDQLLHMAQISFTLQAFKTFYL